MITRMKRRIHPRPLSDRVSHRVWGFDPEEYESDRVLQTGTGGGDPFGGSPASV
jgi:hypothetical protein